MKKQISFLLVACLLLSTLLVGCGSKDTSRPTASSVGNTSADAMTREQWIGMLGDRFGYTEPFAEEDFFSDVRSDNTYYNQIQACAEWEVVEPGATFGPTQKADWSYVIETAVRAIGLDNINNSTAGVTASENALVDFFTANIANIGVSDLKQTPSLSEATQVLDYAYQYYMTLTPADVYQATYNAGVYELEADAVTLKGDGVTAIVNDGASYSAGDVVYVHPTENSAAYALKVVSCDGSQFTYELADMEDVFEELVISGSFTPTVIDAEAADYVSLAAPIAPGGNISFASAENNRMPGAGNSLLYRQSASPAVMGTGVDVKASKNGVTFHANVEGIDFTVSLTGFEVNADVDFGLIKGLKKANATVSFDDKIEVSYRADHFSKTIPLGSATLQIGSTPLQAEVSLVANIGMDGEISVTYASTVVGKVQYSKDKSLVATLDNNNPTFDFHAQVTITAEPTIKIDLQCLSRSIVNFKVTSGIVAVATVDVDLMAKLPACIDIYLYVPLRWAINEDGCVMTAISSKLKKSKTVWNSENSRITKRFHWEDNVLVEECTRGGEEEVKTPVVDEDGIPYEEYKLFEFEEIVFGHIGVAATSVYLNNGETMALGILSIPDGYSKDDLVYSVQDSDICTASGGNVTAIGSGSTVLTISTADGKYSVHVTVVVAAEYNDTSGFEAL